MQSFTETDSTVPSWAKQSAKPTYTASEVGAEPAFTKNGAFNKSFGTASGTVCEGNDSRLSNSRPANGGNADTVDNKHASDFATAAQGTKADTALQSFTEKDPTVPSWAKASSKPSYSASEISITANANLGNATTLQAALTYIANVFGGTQTVTKIKAGTIDTTS